jgi:GT2 family glycosyltransferase
MKLSVVIVSYNVKYFLEQALKSVFKSVTDFDFEVFVVDNASVDGSAAMVANNFPQVHLIDNKENVGFSKANNQAIRLSKAEYILLLNPDTIIREDTLQQVVSFMDQHVDAGALGVKMIDGKGQFLPESKRGFPSPDVAFFKMSGLSKLFPKSKIFGRYHLGYLDENETNEVDVLSGAFMLIRHSVLKKIGLLDEDYFMYGEDIDLSYRIKKAGYKNYYYPHAPIVHFKGESTKKGSLNYVRVFYQAMIIFAHKHITGRAEGIYISLLQIAIYFRAIISLCGRLLKRIGWPMVDILILIAVLLSGKWLWENVVRVSDGLQFTSDLMRINFPLYISVWITCVWLAGGYDRQARLFNHFMGMLTGTLLIGFIYGFLPDYLRSSRGIILYGFALGNLLMYAARLLKAWISGKPRHLFQEERRMVIVGSESESSRVYELLRDISAKREYLGFITTFEKEAGHPQCLGTLEKIDDIISLVQPDELIFCAKDVSSLQLIQQLSTKGGDLDFKIAPEASQVVLGSHSRNDTGELLTYDLGFKINKGYLKRLKRFTDCSLAILFLLLSPLMILFQKNKFRFLVNCVEVLVGKATWVAYCKGKDIDVVLPPLKKGVLCPLDNLSANQMKVPPALVKRLNYLYAREYTPYTDLQIIFNSLNHLGK